MSEPFFFRQDQDPGLSERQTLKMKEESNKKTKNDVPQFTQHDKGFRIRYKVGQGRSQKNPTNNFSHQGRHFDKGCNLSTDINGNKKENGVVQIFVFNVDWNSKGERKRKQTTTRSE